MEYADLLPKVNEDPEHIIDDIRVFALDMDGTVYLGEQWIDGAVDFLARVRESGRKYIFLTNNSSKDAAAYVEKLEKMITQLDKKNASPKKMTKTQEANAANIEVVVGFLADNAPTGFTCADLIKNVDVLEGRSNQYVSAIMKIAVDGGRVEKYTDKRRTYFRAK